VVSERVEAEETTWVEVDEGEDTTTVVGKLEVALDVPRAVVLPVVSEPAPLVVCAFDVVSGGAPAVVVVVTGGVVCVVVGVVPPGALVVVVVLVVVGVVGCCVVVVDVVVGSVVTVVVTVVLAITVVVDSEVVEEPLSCRRANDTRVLARAASLEWTASTASSSDA
jgi:hypothetical protein